MVKLTQISTPKGVNYSDAPQGSPEWIQTRVGRVGASELYDWMAVSKRPNKEGVHTPLKSRADVEHKKAFEITFNVPFSMYTTGAMQEGIDNESFVRDQYSSHLGEPVQVAGAFFDEYSVASPDGLVGKDGGVEIKWLQDNNWSEVVASRILPIKHYYQVQGNLRLSGRKWWDYVAANPNTGRFIVIRMKRDEELIKAIGESVTEVKNVKPFSTEDVYAFTAEVPENITTNDESPWG